MIDSLRIQRFRGLTDVHLEKLARFTLIGGTNSTGKSSILEAIFLFFARQNPGAFASLHQFRGLAEISLDPNSLWLSCFHDYKKLNAISISPTFGSYKPVLTFSYVENYIPKTPIGHNQNSFAVMRTDQSILPTTALSVEMKSGNKDVERLRHVVSSFGLSLEVDLREERTAPAYFIASRIGSNTREDSSLFGQLDLNKKAEHVLEFLKIIDKRISNITTISTANGISTIHCDIGLSRKVPLYQLGDGVVRAMSMIVAISNTENGTVLIDEIGSGIHFSYHGQIAKAISMAAEKFNVQVIATTHSYEFLEAAYHVIKSEPGIPISYMRLDRAADGTHSVQYYDNKMLEAGLANGWEVR